MAKRKAVADGPEIDLREPMRFFEPICQRRGGKGGIALFPDDLKQEMLEHYKKFQVLLIRDRGGRSSKSCDPMSFLRAIWKDSRDASRGIIRNSWSVENDCGTSSSLLTPDALLKEEEGVHSPFSYYVSCIAQTNPALLEGVSELLPNHSQTPPFMFTGATHSEPIWMFFGRNDSKTPMVGRPEHTDLVSHSGTWHAQLAGCKRWYLRPAESDEWGGSAPRLVSSKGGRGTSSADARLCIECEQGDYLLINTRLWRHHTQVPQTALSFSIAKDFYCDAAGAAGKRPPQEQAHEENGSSKRRLRSGKAPTAVPQPEPQPEEFSNLVSLYATKPVRKGDIVLKESELPDCSLPRSLDANCEVALCEDEWGAEEMCLLARRNIKKGDFLAVLPSDSEEDEIEDDDDEVEEEAVGIHTARPMGGK